MALFGAVRLLCGHSPVAWPCLFPTPCLGGRGGESSAQQWQLCACPHRGGGQGAVFCPNTNSVLMSQPQLLLSFSLGSFAAGRAFSPGLSQECLRSSELCWALPDGERCARVGVLHNSWPLAWGFGRGKDAGARLCVCVDSPTGTAEPVPPSS